MFSVEFGSEAKKFLKKAERQIAERIVKKIRKLREDPFPTDVKRVVGKNEKIFRIRVGDYRIQYNVYYDKNLIFISDIGKRENVYG
jgi:mRNA interferase RelE/StbE